MRDSVDICGFQSHEIQPLIPDPPIKRPRVKQRSHVCHQCWSRFTCCSKWMCIFVTILLIVLILIIVRSVLPFGLPWWFPSISYDSSDPHIIFIVADDMGWSDIGYGGSEFPTTAIDALREQGIALDRMYVHESGTATRSSFLSGIPGYSLGLQNGIATGSDGHIPLDVKLLPEILGTERGYATHMVGKWGLGYSKWDYTPTERGFDSFIGFHQRYIDYWHYAATVENMNQKGKNNEMLMGYDLWKNKKIYTPSIQMQYATELFNDELSQILDSHATGSHPDRPMFLYYAIPNPHAPIQFHYEFEKECGSIRDTTELIRYKYCNLMQELDLSISNLVNKLKANDMWDRSIVVFTSDNGGLMCWDVGSVNSCSGAVNLPLRGGKGTLFEGSIRVRTIISGGYIDEELQGTTNHDYIHSTDLFATLADAANVDHEVIYGPDSQQTGVIGIPFWQRLLHPDDVTYLPKRTSPFIADMKLDTTASYIEKAAVFWQGYKYIIQPAENYDGWWQSPLSGVGDIPGDSQAVESDPQPLPNKKLVPDNGNPTDINAIDHDAHNDDPDDIEALPEEADIDIDDGSSSTATVTLKMNEYLFRINEDPAETMNVRLDPANEQILNELRLFLGDMAGAPRYHENQLAQTCADSNPDKFGNVWYPFQENYHG